MFYIIFFLLSILQALIMRRLPQMWTIKSWTFSPTPCYASWGIGWLLVGAAVDGIINWWQLAQIWFAFTLCFFPIFWGMQPPHKANGTDQHYIDNIAKNLKRLENQLIGIIWLPLSK